MAAPTGTELPQALRGLPADIDARARACLDACLAAGLSETDATAAALAVVSRTHRMVDGAWVAIAADAPPVSSVADGARMSAALDASPMAVALRAAADRGDAVLFASTKPVELPKDWRDRKVVIHDKVYFAGREIQILPVDKINYNEREIDVTPAMLAALLSNIREDEAAGEPVVLDYNHGTSLGAASGDLGRAAGYIVPGTARVDSDGLFAVAAYTERAALAIEAGEWNRFSADFDLDAPDRRTVGKRRGPVLNAVALTNLPHVQGMRPALLGAAGARGTTTEDDMDAKAILSALGATAADKITLAATDRDDPAKVLAAVGAALTSALAAADAKATENVTLSARVDALATEVTRMGTEAATLSATKAVDDAIRLGKITPAERAVEIEAAIANRALFDKRIATRPAKVTLGIAGRDGAPPETPDNATAANGALHLAASKILAEGKADTFVKAVRLAMQADPALAAQTSYGAA